MSPLVAFGRTDRPFLGRAHDPGPAEPGLSAAPSQSHRPPPLHRPAPHVKTVGECEREKQERGRSQHCHVIFARGFLRPQQRPRARESRSGRAREGSGVSGRPQPSTQRLAFSAVHKLGRERKPLAFVSDQNPGSRISVPEPAEPRLRAAE